MNTLLKSFYKQYEYFFKELSVNDTVKIGTLGPDGTSSEQALRYFIEKLTYFNDNIKFEKCLMNDFAGVYELLENGVVNYALIPAAYERITDFFWNNHFINNLNFILPTPEYGLASRRSYRPVNDRKTKIACCPAVENIIGYLSDGELKEEHIERIKTNSTAEAVLCLINHGADLAVTNKTSYELYADREIKFISKTYHTDMVWVLFKRKE